MSLLCLPRCGRCRAIISRISQWATRIWYEIVVQETDCDGCSQPMQGRAQLGAQNYAVKPRFVLNLQIDKWWQVMTDADCLFTTSKLGICKLDAPDAPGYIWWHATENMVQIQRSVAKVCSLCRRFALHLKRHSSIPHSDQRIAVQWKKDSAMTQEAHVILGCSSLTFNPSQARLFSFFTVASTMTSEKKPTKD